MLNTLDKLRRGEQATIVALGDSNTELTWHTRGHLNWVGLLQQSLFQTYGRNRALVINAGCCGDTASRALLRLDDDVLRFHPDLVILGFGMNDAWQGDAGLATFSSSMVSLIERCRAVCGAEIVLRTQNPVVVGVSPGLPSDAKPGREWPGVHQGIYARCLVEIGERMGCPVVDHYQLWLNAQDAMHQKENSNGIAIRMSDAIHPGPEGHLAFFRELAPLFEVPTHFCWEV